MEVSVVIVNYNVKYFVEQCVLSVLAASKNLSVEILIVDNHSSDDSVSYLTTKFPDLKIIANQENVGFSKANNQAIEIATGKYVLILNPDTVIAEDTLQKCIAFMQSHSDAGAIGVKMIDGTGTFLPESKRALPTPEVAFYKIFGLSALFPSSKKFGQYHLGFLDKNKNHEVAVLSGAFMFFDKKVLDKIGYFDETFFMYGEDIDLSYRVLLAGYKNYYLADTTIIHYKGESTKKGSLNYVKVFYQAMIIFARKHFVGNRASIFSFLINIAVVFRAIVTLILHLLSSSALFIIDGIGSYVAIFFITTYWASNVKHTTHYYPAVFLGAVIPAYIISWIVAVYFSEGYEKPYSATAIIRGVAIATIAIAAVYGFLPEEWRFSRAIILLGAVAVSAVMLFTRAVYNFLRNERFSFSSNYNSESILLFAAKSEKPAIESILQEYSSSFDIILRDTKDNIYHTLALFHPKEIVVSATIFSYKSIIDLLAKNKSNYSFKIYHPTMAVLIGSDSKNNAGDSYITNQNYRLNKNVVKAQKRIADFVFSIVLSPILFVRKKMSLSDFWQVIFGKKTLVGYTASAKNKYLPKIKNGVFKIVSDTANNISDEDIFYFNNNYAKNYSVYMDMRIILQKVI